MTAKQYRRLMGEVLGTRLWILIVGGMLFPEGSFASIALLLLAVSVLVRVFPYWFLNQGWHPDEADKEPSQ